jgi:hypothetical protein
MNCATYENELSKRPVENPQKDILNP